MSRDKLLCLASLQCFLTLAGCDIAPGEPVLDGQKAGAAPSSAASQSEANRPQADSATEPGAESEQTAAEMPK